MGNCIKDTIDKLSTCRWENRNKYDVPPAGLWLAGDVSACFLFGKHAFRYTKKYTIDFYYS